DRGRAYGSPRHLPPFLLVAGFSARPPSAPPRRKRRARPGPATPPPLSARGHRFPMLPPLLSPLSDSCSNGYHCALPHLRQSRRFASRASSLAALALVALWFFAAAAPAPLTAQPQVIGAGTPEAPRRFTGAPTPRRGD